MSEIVTGKFVKKSTNQSDLPPDLIDSPQGRLVRSNYRYHESTHFRNIGHTLTVAEAANILIGYPLVIPSGSIRRVRRRFAPPLGRFVRISLANIPTSSLCRYTEALRSEDIDEQGKATAHLLEYSQAKRLDFAILLGALLILPLAIQSIIYGFYLALLASILLLALLIPAADTYIRLYRLHSLASLLDREIARRTGQDISNARNLPIMAANHPGS
ncbi:MAG: hypothetical protein PHC51_09075 [bacterium]|nr:hypothetical protein [bacterium]